MTWVVRFAGLHARYNVEALIDVRHYPGWTADRIARSMVDRATKALGDWPLEVKGAYHSNARHWSRWS